MSKDTDLHALRQANHLRGSVSTAGLRPVYAPRRPCSERAQTEATERDGRIPLGQEAIVIRTIISTLVAVALIGATSATALAQQDLRMPDTRDAAVAATQEQDLRGPDAQDAARADEIAAQMRAFTPAPIALAKPAPAASPSDDTPWTVLAGTLVVAFALGVGAAAGLMYLRRARPSTLARS
jgi:hypothetical protein